MGFLDISTEPPTGWRLARDGLLFGIVLIGIVWGIFVLFITPLLDMVRGEAALSIAPGNLAMIFVLPFLTLLVTTMAATLVFGRRAGDRVKQLLPKVLFISIALTVVAWIVAAVGTTPLLESYGYHRCVGLRGEESATDVISAWVRDPKWCQPGKGVDWVREQAAKERG